MALHALQPAETLPLPPSPAVAPGTVGLAVADLANRIEHQESLGTAEGDRYAGALHEQMLMELDTFSDSLTALSEADRAVLSPYAAAIMSEFLADSVDYDAAVDQLISLTPAEKVNFLRRHVSVIEEQASDMASFLEGEKVSFVAELQAADDWVSPAAADAYEDSLATPVEIGDWWQTHAEDSHGYHDIGSSTVVLAQGLGASREERNRDFMDHSQLILKHELAHKEFGTFLPAAAVWLDEPLAVHVSLSMEYGDWGVLNPDDRHSDRGDTHHNQRRLMAEVMEGLDPSLLTRAATSRDPNSLEWTHLNAAIDSKYGKEGTLSLISHRWKRYMDIATDIENDAGLNDYQIAEHVAEAVLKDIQAKKKPQALVGAAAVGNTTETTS